MCPILCFCSKRLKKILKDEQNRMISIARKYLKISDIQLLQSLLSDSKGLYEITLLKREPKDFSLKEIGQEISRGKQIYHLYCLAKRLLPNFSISNENIKYYASLVTYYTVFRLCQLNEWVVYIYLLCFIYHRYQAAVRQEPVILPHFPAPEKFTRALALAMLAPPPAEANQWHWRYSTWTTR